MDACWRASGLPRVTIFVQDGDAGPEAAAAPVRPPSTVAVMSIRRQAMPVLMRLEVWLSTTPTPPLEGPRPGITGD
jgi:hypothetical protein